METGKWPAHIDQETGYRYYTVEQLPRIHRIMALKELGLSLEQIGLMFEEEVPTEQIRGMLRLRQNEIQHSLREEQRRPGHSFDGAGDLPGAGLSLILYPWRCL
jgi:DNA-binding transcriptional MerR regulator